MCSCTHGADRHFIDYAGPGIPGGVLTKCLEPGCPCCQYTPLPTNVTIIPGATVIPSEPQSGSGGLGS